MRDTSDDESDSEEFAQSWLELDSGNASDSTPASPSIQSLAIGSPSLSSNGSASPMIISHNNNHATMMNHNIASSPILSNNNSSSSSSGYGSFFSGIMGGSGLMGMSPKLDFLSKRRRKKIRGKSTDSTQSSDNESPSPLGFSPFSSPLLSSRNAHPKSSDQGLTEFQLFSELPLELRVYPLQWMTVAELNVAALVCKDWAYTIHRSQSLWKGQFHKIEARNAPPVRVCHGALAHRDSLVVYGGHVPSEQGDFITSVRSDLWEYNIASHEWKKICNFEPLTETSPILYNDKMYIFGGFINSWRTSTIVEYDFITKKYTKTSTEDNQTVAAGAPPKGRSAYSAVVYKNCMYIYGGWDGHESMNDIHCYNLDTKQWVQQEQVPNTVAPCVRSHCAWVWNDAMYVWGGYGQHGHPTGLFRYSFLEADPTKRWTEVSVKGAPPCGRSRMKTLVYEDRVILLGGWDRKKLLGDMWELDMRTNTWTQLRHTGLPQGISQYSVNLYKNIMLVFGGCSDGESSNGLYGFKMFDKQS